MALTNAALEAARSLEDHDLIQLGGHVEDLVEVWTAATKEERHQLLSMMRDTVYVDMQAGEIAGVRPNPSSCLALEAGRYGQE